MSSPRNLLSFSLLLLCMIASSLCVLDIPVPDPHAAGVPQDDHGETSESSFCPASGEKRIARLPPLRLRGGILQNFKNKTETFSENTTTYFYDQTLDHFNYNPQSYATFKQRYAIDSTHWGGPESSAPIFVYLGAEASLDFQFPIGFMLENAPHFRALQHGYYGASNPLGSMEKSLKNATLRGYFNSAQALADYAEILVYLKHKLLAHSSPIIVLGASYGGMLASLFRLKYPHIAYGALAASAPILYFDDIIPQDAYYSIVSKDFKEVSESCYRTIQKSWSEIAIIDYSVDEISEGWGWQDIKSVLRKFGSNIIFSNGLRDPYSSGWVLENISDSIVAVTTVNGSHCLDVESTQPSDPQWLLDQRKTEVLIIDQWLRDYNASGSLNATNNK